MSVFLVTNDEAQTYEYKPSSRSAYTILPVATSLTQVLIEHAMPQNNYTGKEANTSRPA